MKILVTGSKGYLGSVLCEHLRNRGYNVVEIDNFHYRRKYERLPYITPNNIENSNGNFCIKMDVRYISENLIRRLNPDCVVHLAALVGEPLCKKLPRLTRSVNALATYKLAQFCKNLGIHLIFMSTCSNYGTTTEIVDEDSPLNPLGIYAKTKVEAEDYVRENGGTIFRCATMFGPSPRQRLDILLNEWTYQALKTRKIELYEPQGWRPLIHVKDTTKAIELAIEKRPQDTFNIGTFNVTKIMLAETIKSEFEKLKLPPVEISIKEEAVDRRSYRVSFEKARSELGFDSTRFASTGCYGHPISELAEGVCEMVRHIQQIPDPDSPIYRNAEGFRK